jgi:hypothetical protein
MIGIITSASRMDELKANVAIIHPRLRVWILPMVSNVESSNMAASPNFNSVAPDGRRKLSAERSGAARSASRLQPRFNRVVEVDQRDPHAVVVALPHQVSAQLPGDHLRRQIVVQAEVAFVERLAAQPLQRRSGSYLVENTSAAEYFLRLLGGAGNLPAEKSSIATTSHGCFT